MFESVSSMCWKTFRLHLPLFLSFVGAIVAGSKALSYLVNRNLECHIKEYCK